MISLESGGLKARTGFDLVEEFGVVDPDYGTPNGVYTIKGPMERVDGIVSAMKSCGAEFLVLAGKDVFLLPLEPLKAVAYLICKEEK